MTNQQLKTIERRSRLAGYVPNPWITRLLAERERLLEALKSLHEITNGYVYRPDEWASRLCDAHKRTKAAITFAESEAL